LRLGDCRMETFITAVTQRQVESLLGGPSSLPCGYAELACKMPPSVRDLVVHNAAAGKFTANDVLRSLGMPELEQRARPSYAGLRSLELLKLLPSAVGSAADIESVPKALQTNACSALREAVDEASFSALDSVDGCTDYQLNLSRQDLEALVGPAAVCRLWSLAMGMLRRERSLPRVEATDQLTAGGAADVEPHEIFVRRYSPSTRPWFPFHKDRSEVTVNVALSSDSAHGGGRLICLLSSGLEGGEVRRLDRDEGCATLHPSTVMHAVSRMTSGVRYSLIIFFGRNEKILQFNAAVRELRG